MAESQSPYPYSAQGLAAIVKCLSDPRFKPYRDLESPGSPAIEHYLYNARLAKSLLFPLHVCEVVVRNAANDVLKANFQSAWYRNPAFESKLIPKTLAALTKAVGNAPTGNVDDLIASMSLDFWSHLFRSAHQSLWWGCFDRVVRAAPATRYADFGMRLRNITGLRNRIAHHEFILNLNLSNYHTEILDVVGYISKETRDWLAAHSTFTRIVRTAPNGSANRAPTLGDRCDANFQCVGMTSTLDQLKEKSMGPWLVYDDVGVSGVITGRELSQYLLTKADADGFLAINEHTAGDVLKEISSCTVFKVLNETEPMIILSNHLTTKLRNVLVADAQGAIKGLIMGAHRRY